MCFVNCSIICFLYPLAYTINLLICLVSRFSCDSPATTEPESRTPRGRGKRGRAAATPPVVEPILGERRLRKRRNNNNPYAAPPSPAKTEVGNKRKGRNIDMDYVPEGEGPKGNKRARNGGKSSTITAPPAPPVVVVMENGFIECPNADCSKKYRHINGLRYHQTHAHKNPSFNAVVEEAVAADCPVSEPAAKEEVKAEPMETSAPETSKDVPASPNSKNRACKKSTNGKKGKKEDTSARSKDVIKKEEATVSIKKEEAKSEKRDKQPTVSLTHLSVDKEEKNSPEKSSGSSALMPPPPTVTIATTGVSSGSTPLGVAGSNPSITSLPVSIPSVHMEKNCKSEGDRVVKKHKVDKGKNKHHGDKPVSGAVMGPPATTTIATVSSSSSQKPVQAKTGTATATSTTAGLAGTATANTTAGPAGTATASTTAGPAGTATSSTPAAAGQTAWKEPKEKKSKKKKNKDKDKEKSREEKSDVKAKTDVKPSLQSLSVIKNMPAAGDETDAQNALAKMAAMSPSGIRPQDSSPPPELQKQGNQPPPPNTAQGKISTSPPALQKQPVGCKVAPSTPSKTNVEGSGQPARPTPPSLTLNTPGQGERENKDTPSTAGANAQSPAYSDISDANDSSQNLEGDLEACHKVGKDATTKPDNGTNKAPPPQADKGSYAQPLYGNYYSQHGNYGKGAPAGSKGSPLKPPKPANSGNEGKDAPGKPDNNKLPPQPLPQRPASKDPQPDSKDVKLEDGVKVSGGKGNGAGDVAPAPPATTQTARDYPDREYQERMLQNARQMYSAHYMGTYGYSMDPAYHMHLMATSPEYKAQYEKWIQEQERRRREYLEQQKRLGMSAGNPANPLPLDLNPKAMDLSKPGAQGKGSPSLPSASLATPSPGTIKQEPMDTHAATGTPTNTPGPASTPGSKSDDRPGKDKVSDSHSGLKEPSEIKKELVSPRQQPFSPSGVAGDNKAQSEELRRYYMYQGQQGVPAPHPQYNYNSPQHHQRLMEQQWYMDKQMKGRTTVPPPTAATSANSKAASSATATSNLNHPSPGPSTPHRPHSREHGSGGRPTPTDPQPRPDSGKDKVKAVQSPSTVPGKGKEGVQPYPPYYPQSMYPGQPPYDPRYPTPGGNSAMLGYAMAPNNFPYPSQGKERFGSPKELSKDTASTPPLGPGKPHPGESNKALEMLQQRASNLYSGHHSPGQKGKDGKLGDSKPLRPPLKDGERGEKCGSPGQRGPVGEGKDRKSPPTQRHVHTHHHTHVVGSPYPHAMYGQFGGKTNTNRTIDLALFIVALFGLIFCRIQVKNVII